MFIFQPSREVYMQIMEKFLAMKEEDMFATTEQDFLNQHFKAHYNLIPIDYLMKVSGLPPPPPPLSLPDGTSVPFPYWLCPVCAWEALSDVRRVGATMERSIAEWFERRGSGRCNVCTAIT